MQFVKKICLYAKYFPIAHIFQELQLQLSYNFNVDDTYL